MPCQQPDQGGPGHREQLLRPKPLRSSAKAERWSCSKTQPSWQLLTRHKIIESATSPKPMPDGSCICFSTAMGRWVLGLALHQFSRQYPMGHGNALVSDANGRCHHSPTQTSVWSLEVTHRALAWLRQALPSKLLKLAISADEDVSWAGDCSMSR